MAQTGYTPILIYSSTTASQAPSAGNLTNSTLGSELAINITDGKLFYKDNGGSVQVIAWKVTPTSAGGTGLTSYTAGDTLYYATGTTLSKLAIGSSGYYMSSSGTAPQWSAPAALTKTDDTNVTLTLGGSPSTALLNAASLTLGWTGQLAVTRGGTGLSTVAQGDLLYGSASNTLSALSKNTTASRYLSNSGTNNNPAWAQIDLSNGVTGTLPIANGGTNSTATPTAGGVGYGTGTAHAYSAAGTSGNVLVSGGSGAPTWTGGPTFTAITKVNMTEAYLGLDAGTLGTGKLWYLISGGGGNVASGYFSIWNGTSGNKVFTIAPSTSEQFTTDTSGNFNMLAGNVVQGTAGKGFNFTANTGAAGKTSQLLNWYEEGTWTPAYATTGNPYTSVTYGIQSGTYTRIGRMVSIKLRIRTSAVTIGTASGALIITGLPFTSAASGCPVTIGYAADFSTNAPINAEVVGSDTTIALYYRATVGGSVASMQYNYLNTAATTNDLTIAGFYYV